MGYEPLIYVHFVHFSLRIKYSVLSGNAKCKDLSVKIMFSSSSVDSLLQSLTNPLSSYQS